MKYKKNEKIIQLFVITEIDILKHAYVIKVEILTPFKTVTNDYDISKSL